MRITWGVLVSLAFASSLALADPPAPIPAPHVVASPNWLERPTRMIYPARAQRARVSGAAKMLCSVTAEGRLESCEVLTETPSGYGFGQAALDMASQFRMRPLTRDGQPVGGAKVLIPIRFQLPDDLPPPPTTPQADKGLPGPPTPPLSIGGKSYWEQAPQDFARFYPDRSQRFNKNGQASLKCVVTAEGRLGLCEVISEDPEGFGFGQSALALSKLFKMYPATMEGRPVGGASVVIPIKFELRPAASTPPPKP